MLPSLSITTMLCSQRASTPFVPFQFLSASSGNWPGAPPPGRAATGPCDAFRNGTWPTGNERLGPELRDRCLRRSCQYGQLAALNDKDSIRTLGEHAFHRSPSPVFVPRQLGHRLWPVANHFVGPGEVPAAFIAGNRRETGAGFGLAVHEFAFWRRAGNRSAMPATMAANVMNCAAHERIPYPEPIRLAL